MTDRPGKKRVAIYFGTEMYDWVKEASDKLGVPVSALIIMAVHQFKMQNTVVPQLEDIISELNKSK